MEPKQEPFDLFDSQPVGNKINTGCHSPLVETKEEPLDDFLLMPAENENVDRYASFLKEAKEEPLSDHFLDEKEISIHCLLEENDCKKEEIIEDDEVVNLSHPSSSVKEEPIVDEYIQDLVRLGQIPAWDAVLDQSARYGISPTLPTEIKSEDVEDDVYFPTGEKRKTVNEGSSESDFAKKSRVAEKSDNFTLDKPEKSTPQCILCEKFPTTSYGYAYHLNHHHKYSLITNGISLRCVCGDEVRSHIRSPIHKCNGHQFTLVKLTRRAQTTPQCILCEVYPSTPSYYVHHLLDHHGTTLTEKGLYVLCSCGIKIVHDNHEHNQKCNGRQFALHKSENSDDHQCVMCEIHPTGVAGYIRHLLHVHASTLLKNGIYLTCSCGAAISTSNSRHRKISCTGVHFAIHKLKYQPTPQCILCSVYPGSPFDYTRHLHMDHFSTLTANGIYLSCSCGVAIFSIKTRHSKICSSVQFTIKTLKIKSTPRCILCSEYPVSAFAYARHLSTHHVSTLATNNIYLLCSCGIKVRHHNHQYLNHGKECNGRQFSLHKIVEE